jgi:hypothetical protein
MAATRKISGETKERILGKNGKGGDTFAPTLVTWKSI